MGSPLVGFGLKPKNNFNDLLHNPDVGSWFERGKRQTKKFVLKWLILCNAWPNNTHITSQHNMAMHAQDIFTRAFEITVAIFILTMEVVTRL